MLIMAGCTRESHALAAQPQHTQRSDFWHLRLTDDIIYNLTSLMGRINGSVIDAPNCSC
jgi:hypothetical protein